MLGDRKEYADELKGKPLPLSPTLPPSAARPPATYKRRTRQASDKKTTSIRIPPEYREILRRIDVKLYKLGHDTLQDGDAWYIGLRLLDTLLDELWPEYVDRQSDLYEGIMLSLKNRPR